MPNFFHHVDGRYPGEFIRRLNALKAGLDLSLSSEARWEYACRAGTVTPYHFGTAISHDLARYASDGPVASGTLPPNQWGLHEMHGNIWEWCEDHWHNNYNGAPQDGSAWLDSGAAAALRVFRGGSWIDGARDVRAAMRARVDPAFRIDDLGFRCARVQSDEIAERRAGRQEQGERSEPATLANPERRGRRK
jgi:formylglycine-generating enzyme required for sulfatase activity